MGGGEQEQTKEKRVDETWTRGLTPLPFNNGTKYVSSIHLHVHQQPWVITSRASDKSHAMMEATGRAQMFSREKQPPTTVLT